MYDRRKSNYSRAQYNQIKDCMYNCDGMFKKDDCDLFKTSKNLEGLCLEKHLVNQDVDNYNNGRELTEYPVIRHMKDREKNK